MNSITGLSPHQLRQAADIKEQLDALQEQLNELLGLEIPTPLRVTTAPKRRKMSAAGRAAIAAAARARWAKIKGTAPKRKARRKFSAAGLAALSAAAKARWAKVRAAGKSRL